MFSPKRTRFYKQHRGRMKRISYRGNHICFGKYAFHALEPAWITSRQIEVGRRAMTRNICRGGKIWVRIFLDKPVTVRHVETCMGSRKGSPEYWVTVVKPGRILYEITRVTKYSKTCYFNNSFKNASTNSIHCFAIRDKLK